jgi:hypothetical protein
MSALTTHTFGNHRKRKRKETNKRNSNKRSKAEKGKEKDHLKKTSVGPLRQGQRLDTSDTKPCQAKSTNHQSLQELPLHICILPLNKCQLWAQTGQAGSQNRSNRFHQNRSGWLPKPVRPIWYSRPHPPKAKNAKEMHKAPLTLGIGSRDAMQLFSTFISPPCCQCMNQGSVLKTCNLELLKYTKIITRCYTCPNEQVRYSTAS